MKIRFFRSTHNAKLALCMLSGGLVASSATFAQDSSEGSASSFIEEIVVTAQKRSQSVQDVPIAIAALTGDQLDKLGVKGSNDIIQLFPNLSSQGANSVNGGFSIRGVGTKNFFPNAEQSVGQYLDEVSLPIASSSQLGLFDLERVEVLNGPQNALFGRNTTGGAVNFISKKPNLDGDSDAYLAFKVGNESRFDVEAASTFALSDSVAIRLAGQSVNRDGIFRNLATGEDLGEIERNSGRAQVLWEVSDVTQITANVHVGYSEGEHAPVQSTGAFAPGTNFTVPCPGRVAGGPDQFENPSNCVSPVPFTDGTQEEVTPGGYHETFQLGPNRADVDLEGLLFRVDHELSFADFVSLTAYDEYQIQFVECASGVPSGFGFCPGFDTDQQVFSQEFRLTSNTDGPLKWLTGLYYSEQDDDIAQIVINTAAGPPFGVTPAARLLQDVEIFSVYGQLDYDLTDRLSATLALRYTSDEKSGVNRASNQAFTDDGLPSGNPLPRDTFVTNEMIARATEGAADCSTGALPCQLNIPLEQDLSEVGGKLGLTYQFTDDVLGYASYSRGFKSGSFDLRAISAFLGTANNPAGPEFIDAYEIGVKSTLNDGALIFNAAMYYYEWEDRQQFSNAPNSTVPVFVNIPESELFGIDFEVKWSPSDSWFIQLGGAYADTEITDSGNLAGVLQGAPLSNAPEFSFSGLVIKTIDTSFGSLSLQTNFKWQDEYETLLEDREDQANNETTFIIGARAALNFGDEEQYEVALWGENLTDEIACATIAVNNATGTNGCIGNDGQAFYGIDVRFNF